MSKFAATEAIAAIGSYERLAQASERMLQDVTALVQGGSAGTVEAPKIVRAWNQIRKIEPLAPPESSLGFADMTAAARRNGRLIFGADPALKRIEIPKDLSLTHESDLGLTAAYMRLLTEDMGAAGFNMRYLTNAVPGEQANSFLRDATRGAHAFVTGNKAQWNPTSQYLFKHYGPFDSTQPAHWTKLHEYQVLDTEVRIIK